MLGKASKCNSPCETDRSSEHADGGIITGSGMAAITAAIMGSLSSGDHLVGGDQLYGRSLRLIKSICHDLALRLLSPTSILQRLEILSQNKTYFNRIGFQPYLKSC